MPDIETVFFDAGGVLVHPNWMRVGKVLTSHNIAFAVTDLSRAELLCNRELDDRHLIGSTNDEQRWYRFFSRTFELAGLQITPETLPHILAELQAQHAIHNLWDSVAPDALDALTALNRAGRRCVVVSNANGTVADLLTRVGLRHQFFEVIDSGVVGVEKPSPAIFYLALQLANASKETTVHVGDFYHIDIVGAAAAGLQAVLLDRGGLHSDRPCRRVCNLAEFTETVLNPQLYRRTNEI